MFRICRIYFFEWLSCKQVILSLSVLHYEGIRKIYEERKICFRLGIIHVIFRREAVRLERVPKPVNITRGIATFAEFSNVRLHFYNRMDLIIFQNRTLKKFKLWRSQNFYWTIRSWYSNCFV